MFTSTSTTTALELEELEVAEYDKAGNLKAKYIESGRDTNSARIDVLVSVFDDTTFTTHVSLKHAGSHHQETSRCWKDSLRFFYQTDILTV